MISQKSKEEIINSLNDGKTIPNYLKKAVIDSINNGEGDILGTDMVCCQYRDTTGPILYSQTDSKTCSDILGGTSVAESNCQA